MSRGQLALDAAPATVPTAAVSIVAASGDLDEAAAVRLLRWCEARLHLLDIGHGQIDHLVLDVSHARRATASAVAIWIMPVPKPTGAGSGFTWQALGR